MRHKELERISTSVLHTPYSALRTPHSVLDTQVLVEDLVESIVGATPELGVKQEVSLFRTMNFVGDSITLLDLAALFSMYPFLYGMLMRSLATACASCFVVMLVTTRVLSLTLFATTTVAAIVATIMGCLEAPR